MKDITIEDIFVVIILFLLSIVFVGILVGIYNWIFIKDEVTCLGGHYEWRYNPNTKTMFKRFICDSAKIIYK